MTKIALPAADSPEHCPAEHPTPPPAASKARDDAPRDYLVHADGRKFAGLHLLVDAWGTDGLEKTGSVEALLREAATQADATILHVHVHEFGDNGGGISGVAVLAESHISVHTWPEIDYAAFDIFMCGNCSPQGAVEHLRRELGADRFEVREIRRGLVT